MARLTNLTNRGLETQELLRTVLIQLISEKPYDKISIKDITERAGIDRTTFYLHFKDKDELFANTQQAIINDLFEAGVNSGKPYPRATIVFEHMRQHARTYRSLLQIHGGSFFSVQLQGYLQEAIDPLLSEFFSDETGISREEKALLVNYMVGAFRGIAQWWLDDDTPFSAEEMGKKYVELLKAGIPSMRNKNNI